MRGTTHQAVNVALGLALCQQLQPALNEGAVFVGSVFFSSRLPDQLECRNLLAARRRRMTRRLEKQLDHEPTDAEKQQAGIMRWHIPHRGPTHRLLTGVLCATIAWLLAACFVDLEPYAWQVAAGVLLGHWWHSLGDCFTLKPVELWPGRWVHLAPERLRFRADGVIDTLLALAATGASVGLLLSFTARGLSVAKAGEHCRHTERAARVYLSKAKYPHIIDHIKLSWRKGYPHVLAIRRRNADRRRDKLLADIPSRPGFDRDEAPAAMLRSTVKADVAYVPSSENRSAGASMGHQLAGYCGGQRVVYVFSR